MVYVGSLFTCMAQFQSCFSCCIVSYLTTIYLSIHCLQLSLWSTQCVQAFWLKNELKSSPFHHCAWQLVWGVCSDMLWFFSKHGVVHYGQAFPFSCLLSQGHCVLWFVRMQLCKLKLCCHVVVFFKKEKSWQHFQANFSFSFFLIVLSWMFFFCE